MLGCASPWLEGSRPLPRSLVMVDASPASWARCCADRVMTSGHSIMKFAQAHRVKRLKIFSTKCVAYYRGVWYSLEIDNLGTGVRCHTARKKRSRRFSA